MGLSSNLFLYRVRSISNTHSNISFVFKQGQNGLILVSTNSYIQSYGFLLYFKDNLPNVFWWVLTGIIILAQVWIWSIFLKSVIHPSGFISKWPRIGYWVLNFLVEWQEFQQTKAGPTTAEGSWSPLFPHQSQASSTFQPGSAKSTLSLPTWIFFFK